MEWYQVLGVFVLIIYLIALGGIVGDTNKRVKHIESEFTLEGGK